MTGPVEDARAPIAEHERLTAPPTSAMRYHEMTPRDVLEEANQEGARPTDDCEHDWHNRVSGGSLCSKCDVWQDKRVTPPTDDALEALAWEVYPDEVSDHAGRQEDRRQGFVTGFDAGARRQGVTADALDRAFLAVESKHHFHGVQCLCGFESHRSRSRTEHITAEVRADLEAARDAS